MIPTVTGFSATSRPSEGRVSIGEAYVEPVRRTATGSAMS